MSGYIFIDGRPVANAHLHIENLRTHGETDVWTTLGPDSDLPYYRVGLSEPPLNAIAGDVLDITIKYASHITNLKHTVIGGGQQVDGVLARSNASDYTFDRQFWQQSPQKTFNMYKGEVAIDGADTVYVADWGNARIQVFNRNGDFVRQWGTLGLAPGQFQNPSGIATDRLGNVYVSDTGTQRIQKFTATGEWIATWGGFGTDNGQFRAPRDLVVDTDGSVYITDEDNNRVQKFTSDGTFVATFGTSGNGNGQFIKPGGIALGPDGLYIADTGNNRIEVLTRSGAFVRAWGAVGSGNGQFDRPERVGVAPNGNVYVADTNSDQGDSGNNRIQVFSNTGTYLNQWGQVGQGNGAFSKPGGIAFTSDGQVYVADSENHRMQVFSAAGTYLNQWGTRGDGDAKIVSPDGVALDSSNNLYVADMNHGYIKKFSSTGTLLQTISQPGSGDGQLNVPRGVAVDANGNMYVADSDNHRIQVFNASGAYVRQWGNDSDADGGFREPVGLALDTTGNVYVADSGNHRIQKFSATGVFQWKQGGVGASNAPGQFFFPRSIAVGTNGTVYVADTNNDRIQTFNTNGVYTGQWGGLGTGNGQFDAPSGIAVDAKGTVYVADFNNSRFQRFTSNGTWISNWGVNGASVGQFVQPTRIVVGADGRVYISELNLGRVQVLRFMTFTQPIATIVASSSRTVTAGQPIDLVGMGSVSDVSATIASYEWSLNDAPFATSATATLPTTGLSPGQYRISLRVRDTLNVLSDPVEVSLTVATTVDAAPTSWTMMLYLDGDNNNIAPSLNADSPLGALYQLEHTSAPANVTVVALYDGDRVGGGDSYRYVLRPGVAAQVIPVPEVNMGDPQTLVDFVAWGKQQAPADAYYLSIADHANAIDGIAWDFTSGPTRTERLTNPELRQALVAITDNGVHPIDVLHLDACLMGLTESAYQVRGLASYLVVSENLAWSAFAYADYRAAIRSSTTPAALAQVVADRYAQIVGTQKLPLTISALDMSQIDTVAVRVNALAGELLRYALVNAQNRDILAAIRAQAQKLDSGGNTLITQDDEYVDLSDWVRLVQQGVPDSAVQNAAANVQSVLPSLVIVEHHATGITDGITVNVDHTHGLALYYPPKAGVQTYQTYRNELNFATDTLWDEFLQAGFSSQPIASAAAPNPVAPGILPPIHQTYIPIIGR